MTGSGTLSGQSARRSHLAWAARSKKPPLLFLRAPAFAKEIICLAVARASQGQRLPRSRWAEASASCSLLTAAHNRPAPSR